MRDGELLALGSTKARLPRKHDPEACRTGGFITAEHHVVGVPLPAFG
jgi:hypothetical protein